MNKKIIWKHEGAGSFISSPAVSGNKIVIGSQDKNVYCFDKPDGNILWTFKTKGKITASPVIIVSESQVLSLKSQVSYVIIPSFDGRVYILNLSSGQEIWSYEIGSPISSTPAVTGNLIIIGAEDGRVYAFGEK